MEDLRRELEELRRRVDALEAEVARLRADTRGVPLPPADPDHPWRRPGLPPDTLPRMSADDA
jgi:hypothetical protein